MWQWRYYRFGGWRARFHMLLFKSVITVHLWRKWFESTRSFMLINPILVINFVDNDWWNIGKKTFFSPFLRHQQEGREKTTQANAKLFMLQADAAIVRCKISFQILIYLRSLIHHCPINNCVFIKYLELIPVFNSFDNFF